MATQTFDIDLTGSGSYDVSTYHAGDKDDTQYITLTDGGNISSVQLTRFGMGGASETGEGPGGDDEIHIDLSSFNDDFSIDFRSVDSGDTFYVTKASGWSNVGDVYTINYTGSDGFTHTIVVDVDSQNSSNIMKIVITCFARGTSIDTPDGEVCVEDLMPGDKVLCADGIARPIQWCASRWVTEYELKTQPNLAPIRIRKNALGKGLPKNDLLVSPQHKIRLQDWRAELLFAESEVLVPAKFLVNDKNIMRDTSVKEVQYFHIMFDSHQIICSNGIETESFHPGDMALDAIGRAAREELLALFPNIENDLNSYGPACLPALKSYEALALLPQP